MKISRPSFFMIVRGRRAFIVAAALLAVGLTAWFARARILRPCHLVLRNASGVDVRNVDVTLRRQDDGALDSRSSSLLRAGDEWRLRHGGRDFSLDVPPPWRLGTSA